jgi:hypothetical protein
MRTCERIFNKLFGKVSIIAFLFFLTRGLIGSPYTFNQYDSSRFLGQGDTGVSTTSGFDSVFYNPAGLAKYNSFINEAVLASPQIMASPSLINNYKTFMSNNTTADSMIHNFLYNKYDLFYGDVQNLSGVYFKNMGLSGLVKASALAYTADNLVNGLPQVEMQFTAYQGGVVSFYHAFKPNFLAGLNFKYLQKSEFDYTLTASEVLQGISKNELKQDILQALKRGYGIGADVGLMYHYENKASFGINIKNIVMDYQIPFQSYDSPSSDLTMIDAGASWTFHTSKSSFTIACDVTDVLNRTNDTFYKHVHLGATLDYNNLIGIMAGLNQGYLTYGGFINLKYLRLEGGQYSEEIGTLPGDLESPRYFVRLSVGWLK